jgi:F-type H+-transporting ATPase subunit epsilon
MEKEDLHLEIVTPDNIVYDGPIGLVTVPGSKGKFTLLKQHAPIISALGEGEIRVIGKDGVENLFACESGILECQNNKVTILVSKLK